MVGELEGRRELCQSDAVHYVGTHWPDCVRAGRSGAIVFTEATLREFRKLTDGTVVWVTAYKYWRKREAYDAPGRAS